MAGKLPIDRVRENEQAPNIKEQNKQHYTEKQAKLKNELLPPVAASETPINLDDIELENDGPEDKPVGNANR